MKFPKFTKKQEEFARNMASNPEWCGPNNIDQFSDLAWEKFSDHLQHISGLYGKEDPTLCMEIVRAIEAAQEEAADSSVLQCPLVRGTGMTVAEFKRLVAGWPETGEDGEPTGVWVEIGRHLSSTCTRVEVLNRRDRDDGTPTGDLLLAPQETVWPARENDEQPDKRKPERPLRWITNFPASVKGLWPRRAGVEYLEGPPKATEEFTVQEFAGMNYVGVYVDMPEDDYRKLPLVRTPMELAELGRPAAGGIGLESRRFNGFHWWFGISNEVDCWGHKTVMPRWHVVSCWTADGKLFAAGPHFTDPMEQYQMGGKWGPQIFPPGA